MSTTPIATSKMGFATKYGNAMSPKPQSKGTTACCFLPYMKKPSPTEPNRMPHRSADVLNAISFVARAAARSGHEAPANVGGNRL